MTGHAGLVLLLALMSVTLNAFGQDSTFSRVQGLTLAPHSAEDLDEIQQVTGRRVGVLVLQVAAGSAAAAADVKPNDRLLTVGDRGVASSQEVNQALAGKAGNLASGGRLGYN